MNAASVRISEQLLKCHTFNCDLKSDYKAYTPKLPVPASKNQCLEAIDTLKSLYQDETRYAKWKAVYDKLRQSTVETIRSFNATALRNIVFNHFGLHYSLDLIQQWVHTDLKSTLSAHFQEALHVMLESQDEELKNMALEPFSQHLNRKNTREKVNIRGTTGQVPLEIADMILSYCSLESCVSLRQVSSFWFNVYIASDHVMEAKLNARNPWIIPEGDMVTWGDCALVFNSRISKWKSVSKKNQLDFSQKRYTPKILTATPLRYGEKVPTNFEPLDIHDIYQDRWVDKSSDKLYMFTEDKNQVRLDPKTLETEICDRVGPVVESTKDRTVIKYAGYELTLPPDIDTPHVSMEAHHIRVSPFEGGEYVFPTRKPYWEKAYKLRGGGYELGLVWWVYNKPVDPFSGQEVDWLVLGQPLACYNGLVWLKRGDRVFPVLYDAQTPEIVYYSDEKSVVVGNPVVDNRYWIQSRTQPNTQFLTQDTCRGFSVLDLETGIVTEVENPEYELRARAKPEDCFFAGIVGEKFHVWCMDHKTVKRYYAETYGISEEDVERKLNDADLTVELN